MHDARGPTSSLQRNNDESMLPEAGIFEQSTSSRGSALGEDRIRLVRIEPIGDDATIHCNTHVFSASGGVSYTALSYTWGSGRRDQTILLDGEDHRVSKNLYRFLHQARQLGHHFSGWLWIDALSIDQENLQEKFHQVKIISKIFGHAKQIVVWLGPAYADSDQAMQELLSGRFRAGRKTHYQRILQCADPRDRVYALLSVATEGHEHIEPVTSKIWVT